MDMKYYIKYNYPDNIHYGYELKQWVNFKTLSSWRNVWTKRYRSKQTQNLRLIRIYFYLIKRDFNIDTKKYLEINNE
jgi:hypothetical protein